MFLGDGEELGDSWNKGFFADKGAAADGMLADEEGENLDQVREQRHLLERQSGD